MSQETNGMFFPDSLTTCKSDIALLSEETPTTTIIDSISEMRFEGLHSARAPKSGGRFSSPAANRPWALETNALSWATLRPSVGIEYAFAPRWSASLNFDIAWWRQRSKDRFYRLWTLSPEIRYWFGGYDSDRTFYVGVHALSGSYDLKAGRVGYWNESLVEAGISAGYAMRLNHRLALRFSLGGGYLDTSYRKYTRHYDMGEHYVYDGTGHTTYWGITKAEVSFRWNLGKKK